jgi:RimJ/RimL family protein N-acetyltransferase
MESIKTSQGRLNAVTYSDNDFIHLLFNETDVRKYYVLMEDHSRNLDLFVQYMIDGIQNKTGLNYIIVNSVGEKVGLITAELMRDNRSGQLMWNVGYAILVRYRNQGYATSALRGLSDYLLNNFSIQFVSLDICESNVISQAVAAKCVYKKPEQPGTRIGYFDPEHMDLGMRIKWTKSAVGQRAALFNQAVIFFRNRDYTSSIQLFKQALQEDYQQGTPFTDAQIYSNMGMAYSSSRNYTEAYKCLMKAKSLGLMNGSIERELTWLKNNVGLG